MPSPQREVGRTRDQASALEVAAEVVDPHPRGPPSARDDAHAAITRLAEQLLAEVQALRVESEARDSQLHELREQLGTRAMSRKPTSDESASPCSPPPPAGATTTMPVEPIADGGSTCAPEELSLPTDSQFSRRMSSLKEVLSADQPPAAAQRSDDAQPIDWTARPEQGFTQEQEEFRSRIAVKRQNQTGDLEQRRGRSLRGYLEPAIEGARFNLAIFFIIVLNSLCTALEIQYTGTNAGHDLGLDAYSHSASEIMPFAPSVFSALDKAFFAFFAGELLTRFYVYRCKTFLSPWSWIDIFAVFMSPVAWFSLAATDPTLARMVRLARVAKVVRALRMAQHSKKLDILLMLTKSLPASATTLGWSTLLLFTVQSMVGMVFALMAAEYITDTSNALADRQALFAYYGTFSRVTITMFEAHFANWAPACRVLENTLGELAALAFIAYRCFAGFALLSVVGSVFIQQTMLVAHQDEEVLIARKTKEKVAYSKQLVSLFQALDQSRTGLVSWEQIKSVVEDPKIEAWMHALELDMSHIELIFTTLDNGENGSLSPEELVAGALMLKGPSKNLEMLRMSVNIQHLLEQMDLLCAGTAHLQSAHHQPSSKLRRAGGG